MVGTSSLVSGLKASVVMSVMTRVLTFGLNIILARKVNRDDYGVAYVNLEMFNALGLFLMKEGFRRASIRLLSEDMTGKSSFLICWVAVILTAVVNVLLLGLWLAFPLSDGANGMGQAYMNAVVMMFIANLIEAIAEPFVIYEIRAKRLRTKPIVEGCALVLRTASMTGLCLVVKIPFVSSYAASQIIFACAWLFGFIVYGNALDSRSHALPRLSELRVLVRTREWRRVWLKENRHAAMCRQMLLSAGQKMILGRGEKIILLALFDEATWGSYALVSNLGSLVLRTLFAPVEEIAFSFFSSEARQSNRSSRRDDRLDVARVLLGAQGIVGLVALVYGPPNSYVAVRLLYGHVWAEDGDVVVALQMYCVYLFFAALNGILEAYVHAIADVSWMRANAYFQGACSFVLCALSWFLRSRQACGLILATGFCMLLRVLRCVFFLETPTDWLHRDISTLVAAICAGGACSVIASAGSSLLWHVDAAGGAGEIPFRLLFLKDFVSALVCLVATLWIVRRRLRNLASGILSVRASAKES
eukprot:g84.t1